jgi:hypothetical protein
MPTYRVPVWFSKTTHDPKIHLDPACKGLERVQEENLATEKLTSLRALALSEHRPCRVCALTQVATWALGCCRTESRYRTFLTFSSQPSLEVDRARFRENTVSESGRERLELIAARTGLSMVSTISGPVLYGFAPQRAAYVISRSLRTALAPLPIARTPAPESISAFWAFYDDEQRSLSDTSAWQMTIAVTADPALTPLRNQPPAPAQAGPN